MKQISYKELWDIKTEIAAFRDKFNFKRQARLSELIDMEIEQIIEKFSFKTMQSECVEFCPMLAKGTPCHNNCEDDLNCYACFCPNYDLEVSFDRDQNLYKIGNCRIN